MNWFKRKPITYEIVSDGDLCAIKRSDGCVLLILENIDQFSWVKPNSSLWLSQFCWVQPEKANKYLKRLNA